MRILTLAVLTLVLATPAMAEDKKPAAGKPAATATPATPAAPKVDANKALNAMGLTLARSLEQFNFDKAELEKVLAGVREGLSGKPPAQKLDQAAQENIRNFLSARMNVIKDAEKKKSEAYVAKMAKEKGAVATKSGVLIFTVKEGTGAVPGPNDKVKANYVGTLPSGKQFDASKDHGGPLEFNLGGGVIPCWTEAIQKMKVGGKAKIVCPAPAAYGENPPPGIPPNAALTFEIELVSTTPPPPPPPPTPASPVK